MKREDTVKDFDLPVLLEDPIMMLVINAPSSSSQVYHTREDWSFVVARSENLSTALLAEL